MKNPAAAFKQLAREELGIDRENLGSPLREGLLTGIATGSGAVILLSPFLFLIGPSAVWFAIGLTHFAVGASRAIFTGRTALRSGIEMFVVGMGVALVTFLLGQQIHVHP